MDRTDVASGYGDQCWTHEQVNAALTVLRHGGLILVKGDIGYGLFGTSESAIRKMYLVKGRPYSNPCIFIGNLAVLDEVGIIEHEAVRRWVANLTTWTTCAVVVPARLGSSALERMDPWVRQQAVTDGTLAVFLRTGLYIDEIVRTALYEGWVFVGSSANKSSTGNTFHFSDLPHDIVAAADLVVDHGSAQLANHQRLATTIVNFANWTITRKGVNYDRIKVEFDKLKLQVNPDA